MTKPNWTTQRWETEARKWANIAGDEWREDHINMLDIRSSHGVLAIFGNNGYRQDERTRKQVEFLRERMKAAGIRELGFGLSKAPPGYPDDAGYTWCIILDTVDEPIVDGLKREVWAMYRGVQAIRALPDDQ